MSNLAISSTQLYNYAKKYIGTKESPENSNKQKFGEDFGVNGVAWCAIFVYFCFKHVKGGVPLENPAILGGVQRSYMSTDYMMARMKAAGWKEIENASSLAKGDIIFWQFNTSGSDVNHVSICKTATSSTITSLDGNSGDSSENDGGEVSIRKRSASLMYRAYRPPYRNASSTSLRKAVIALFAATGVAATGFASITGKTTSEVEASLSPTTTTTTTTATASSTATSDPITCVIRGEWAQGDYSANVNRIRVALGMKSGRLYTKAVTAEVKAFQKKNGIAVDGEVGKKTARLLVYKGATCTWEAKQ